MRVLAHATSLILANVLVTTASAQQVDAPSPQQIDSVNVSDGIHMLSGKGGNIGVLIGNDGTFMIDDKFAPMTDAIPARVTELGGSTPKFVLNTHYHGDHTGDAFFNGFFPFIDTDHGGTVKGAIAATDAMLALADESTRIIPGHGPLAGKSELSDCSRPPGDRDRNKTHAFKVIQQMLSSSIS